MTNSTKTNEINELKTEVIELLLENICDENDQDQMKESVEEYFFSSDEEHLNNLEEVMEDFRLFVEISYGEVTWM